MAVASWILGVAAGRCISIEGGDQRGEKILSSELLGRIVELRSDLTGAASHYAGLGSIKHGPAAARIDLGLGTEISGLDLTRDRMLVRDIDGTTEYDWRRVDGV